MAFTFAQDVANAFYTTRLTVTDYNGEDVRKVNLLKNLADIGGTGKSSIQKFWRAYETLTEAAHSKATGSIEVLISGQKSTATATGQNAKISDRLVLWFTQPHPLNANRDIWASFVIVAPVNEIVNQTPPNAGQPIMDRESGTSNLTDYTTPEEALGALVNYLEAALSYTAVDDSVTVGGWDYVGSSSALVTVPRIIGGSAIS